MYLRTNRHIGTARSLNLEELIRSLERDGAQDKEVTKLTGILGKGGLVDKGHFWYRLARPLDGVREDVEAIDSAVAVLLTPTECAAKELERLGVVVRSASDMSADALNAGASSERILVKRHDNVQG